MMFRKANIYFFVKQLNIYYRRQSAVSIKSQARPSSCRRSARIYERLAARAWGTCRFFCVQREQHISEKFWGNSSK